MTCNACCDSSCKCLCHEASGKEIDDEKGQYFPPPWNVNEHPERTIGWIEFQKLARIDPTYFFKEKIGWNG